MTQALKTTKVGKTGKTRKLPKNRAKASKTTPKKSILAPLAGILVMVLGFGLLNSQLIAAQIVQRTRVTSVPAQSQVISRSTHSNVNDPPALTLPQLGIVAPIIDEPSVQESDIQNSLKRGVVHYANTAYPGQKGNVVLFGHSSGLVWSAGDYKFVFTRLNALKTNDLISVNFKGVRYTYKVADSTVVPPTDFSVVQQTSTTQLTLITCTPVGTSKNRLVVHALQVSPDPATIKAIDDAATRTVTAGTLPK